MPKSQKNNALKAVFWWVVWISATIGSFFIASSFWTPIIARKFGSIHETRNAVIWVTAVFGTWLLFLVPLIVTMYSKVDKAYEDARLRREKAANRFRSILVEREKRLIPDFLRIQLAQQPETIEGGHLVNVVLKDGREIQNVFIAGRTEVLGIYDAETMDFEGKDIQSLHVNSLERPSFYLTSQWLRLDGISSPE